MRDKRRYLLVETSEKITDDERTFSNNLYQGLSRAIGEMGYHHVSPKVMKIVDENHFIIRSNLDGTGTLVAALALVKRINNSDIAFYTLKSSGTIRAVQAKG